METEQKAHPQALSVLWRREEMWTGSGEPPSWWPTEFPDIYVTDSPEVIKEKVESVPTNGQGTPETKPSEPSSSKDETAGGIGFGSVPRPRRRGGGGWFSSDLND